MEIGVLQKNIINYKTVCKFDKNCDSLRKRKLQDLRTFEKICAKENL